MRGRGGGGQAGGARQPGPDRRVHRRRPGGLPWWASSGHVGLLGRAAWTRARGRLRSRRLLGRVNRFTRNALGIRHACNPPRWPGRTSDLPSRPRARVRGGGAPREPRRRIRPSGRVRLDALARMLQDVSDDDTTDAGLARARALGGASRHRRAGVPRVPRAAADHVVLRHRQPVGRAPGGDRRRHGGQVDAAVLWVHLDPTAGRPGALARGVRRPLRRGPARRSVRARLATSTRRPSRPTPFPLRFCDFDVMGHVNNAVSWESRSRRPSPRARPRLGESAPRPRSPPGPRSCSAGRVRSVDRRRRARTCSTAAGPAAGADSRGVAVRSVRGGDGRRFRHERVVQVVAHPPRDHLPAVSGGARGGRRSRTRPSGPTSAA